MTRARTASATLIACLFGAVALAQVPPALRYQGYLADAMHAAVQQMQGVDDAEWQRKKAQMSGHPNTADLRAAKEFAIAALVDERE